MRVDRTDYALAIAGLAASVDAAQARATQTAILTAIAAALAFIPLTQSVFWSSLAFTLIGGTILTLGFLPALYALCFRIRPVRLEQSAPARTAPASN